MKKGLFILIALSSVLLIAGQAAAVITGTSHDLRSLGLANGINQICIPCHTPHNADVSNPNLPLWNRDQPNPQGFEGLGWASDVCLSCHDGTIAVDKFGEFSGTTNMTEINGGRYVVNDVDGTHPVGSDAIYANSSSPMEPGITDSSSPVKTFDGQVECSSCHNVHDNTYGSFLADTMDGSTLCLDCHAL
jgi:predicted CXXCH cytochrome family protein